MDIEQVLKIARTTRKVLLEEFADNPTLKNNCRRASIILHEVLKIYGKKSRVMNGEIRSQGHMWVELRIENNRYLLDITLTQFYPEAKPVILERLPNIKNKYPYKTFWQYSLDRDDVYYQKCRIEKVLNQLEEVVEKQQDSLGRTLKNE